MTNPIHYSDASDEYYVWLSRLGVKYMKYFRTADGAFDFVRRNPRICMELRSNDPISDAWASEASASIKAHFAAESGESDGDAAAAGDTVDQASRGRKDRFASALDVVAFSLPITLLVELGIGGLIPIAVVGGLCAYLSFIITRRISQSNLTITMRMGAYCGLVVAYLSGFIAVLFAIESLK